VRAGVGLQAELHEDLLRVCLDGPLGDEEARGNRLVRVALGDEAEYLALAVGQCRERIVTAPAPDETAGRVRRQREGTGLRQILSPSVSAGLALDWSPQGNDIVFSRHVTPDAHSSLWLVHADGSGLRQVNVPAGSFK
jgi:hypothetical protein